MTSALLDLFLASLRHEDVFLYKTAPLTVYTMFHKRSNPELYEPESQSENIILKTGVWSTINHLATTQNIQATSKERLINTQTAQLICSDIILYITCLFAPLNVTDWKLKPIWRYFTFRCEAKFKFGELWIVNLQPMEDGNVTAWRYGN